MYIFFFVARTSFSCASVSTTRGHLHTRLAKAPRNKEPANVQPLTLWRCVAKPLELASKSTTTENPEI